MEIYVGLATGLQLGLGAKVNVCRIKLMMASGGADISVGMKETNGQMGYLGLGLGSGVITRIFQHPSAPVELRVRI